MSFKLKLDENLFVPNEANSKNKNVYAKIFNEGGRTYFQLQLEIEASAEISADEKDNYRDVLHPNSLITVNGYESGSFKIKHVDDDTSDVFITLEAGTKAPGGSGH